MKTKLFTIILFVLLIGLLAACGGAPEGGIPDNAALKITGAVGNEIGWAEDSLKKMDTMDAESTNKKGETETYTGVSLNALLDKAQPNADATTLVLVADDGFEGEVPLADAKACATCIVSFRDQGGFSMVMPDFDGKAQVKGVVEIKVQ